MVFLSFSFSFSFTLGSLSGYRFWFRWDRSTGFSFDSGFVDFGFGIGRHVRTGILVEEAVLWWWEERVSEWWR